MSCHESVNGGRCSAGCVSTDTQKAKACVFLCEYWCEMHRRKYTKLVTVKNGLELEGLVNESFNFIHNMCVLIWLV